MVHEIHCTNTWLLVLFSRASTEFIMTSTKSSNFVCKPLKKKINNPWFSNTLQTTENLYLSCMLTVDTNGLGYQQFQFLTYTLGPVKLLTTLKTSYDCIDLILRHPILTYLITAWFILEAYSFTTLPTRRSTIAPPETITRPWSIRWLDQYFATQTLSLIASPLDPLT